MSVLLETTLGDIIVDLHYKKCPRTCLNFIKLCKIKYYNFCLFHNIERDYTAQTGDPLDSGKGGSCVFNMLNKNSKEYTKEKYFEPEFHPKLSHTKKGTVSMAVSTKAQAKVSGSQFFITLEDNLSSLDDRHSIFGIVAEGFEVLDKLNDLICDQKGCPMEDVRITHTVILDDPFPDPPGLCIPDRSPEPSIEMLKSTRLTKEYLENTASPHSEPNNLKRKKQADAHALTLELMGDLPFSEVKPPENALFVCKLNPLTQEEDLELIFSRFGKILSCEIVKDSETHESLGYGFIEYESNESCETAYLKMDNVLIDDRRIHVDFSQSVSRFQKRIISHKTNTTKKQFKHSD